MCRSTSLAWVAVKSSSRGRKRRRRPSNARPVGAELAPPAPPPGGPARSIMCQHVTLLPDQRQRDRPQGRMRTRLGQLGCVRPCRGHSTPAQKNTGDDCVVDSVLTNKQKIALPRTCRECALVVGIIHYGAVTSLQWDNMPPVSAYARLSLGARTCPALAQGGIACVRCAAAPPQALAPHPRHRSVVSVRPCRSRVGSGAVIVAGGDF